MEIHVVAVDPLSLETMHVLFSEKLGSSVKHPNRRLLIDRQVLYRVELLTVFLCDRSFNPDN